MLKNEKSLLIFKRFKFQMNLNLQVKHTGKKHIQKSYILLYYYYIISKTYR